MNSQQLAILTQIMTQQFKQQNVVSSSKDGGSFKDLINKKNPPDKKQPNLDSKPNNVANSGKDKTDTSNSGQKEDVSAKQTMLANMLFGQIIQPVINTENLVDENVGVQTEIVDTNVLEGFEDVVPGQDEKVIETKKVDTNQHVEESHFDVFADKNVENEHVEKKVETFEKKPIEQKLVGENHQTKGSDMFDEGHLSKKGENDNKHSLEIGDSHGALFKNVDNMPIKVGEATEVLDTQSSNMQQDFNDIIKYNLRKVGDKIEIKLNPSNLGKITVELTHKDGAMAVVITTENSKAMSLLAQNSGGLENLLKEQFSQPVQVHVEQNNQQQQQFNGEGQSKREQRERKQEPSKDEQQNFVEQLRLGLLQVE